MPADPNVSSLWPADNPAVAAHISLLQGIITRLANNSASCKTWCITLISALIGLAGAAHAPGVIRFVLVPIAIFGFMDSMYLAQERAYRNLYARMVNAIRTGSYTMANAYEAAAPIRFSSFFAAFASWSVYPMYGGLIILYVVAIRAGWLQIVVAIK